MSFLFATSLRNVRISTLFNQCRELAAVNMQFLRFMSSSKPVLPKRPLSAYLMFHMDNYAGIQEKHPGVRFGEVAKISSQMWKEASQSEKSQYLEKAKTLFAEYRAKCDALPPDQKEEIKYMAQQKRDKIKIDRLRREENKDKPKRPGSAFTVFVSENYKDIVDAKLSFAENSRKVASAWKSLSEGKRDQYQKTREVQVENYRKEMELWREKKRKN